MMGESDDKRGFFKKLLTVPSTETDAIRLVSPLFGAPSTPSCKENR
jgi:hypothetical protein